METLKIHKLLNIPSVLLHAIEQSPGCISISDMTSPIQPLIYTNESFLKLTGYDRSEIIGKNCNFLQGPLTDPKAIQKIRDTIDQKISNKIDILNYRKDGTTFLNQLSLSPVFDDHKKLIAYIGIQSDISDLVEQHAEELETSKFHSLGLFSSNLAHEINNYLQPMVGLTDFIAQAIPQDEIYALEDIKIIKQSALEATNVLKSVLHYSKANVDELQELDIITASLSSLEFIKKLIPVTIKLNYDDFYTEKLDEPVLCKFNPYQLTQIYMNLINNAIDALENHGEIGVHFTIENSSITQTKWIDISVTNAGEPIAEHIQKNIFDKFISSKKKKGGTGLGLSIVKSIIENWQGQIDFVSNKTIGTKFYFKLPVTRTK